MPRTLPIAVLLLVLALPWVVWGHLPAPTLEVWYLAAFAGQVRGIWIVALTVAAGLALAARARARRAGRGRVRVVASAVVALASLGVVGAAVQEARIAGFARERGVELSPTDHLLARAGSTGDVPERPIATVPYAKVEGRELLLDVWDVSASAASAPRPAIVRVHGGSWAFGERSESSHWCRVLVEHGVVVFDVEYRLTPPPRWRDAIADVKAAVLWVRAHAADWNVDPGRVGVMGASAGGHLALGAAYANDDDVPPTPPLDVDLAALMGDRASRVRAAIAFSPPVVLSIGFDADYPWWYPQDLRSTRRIEELTGGTPASHPERYRLASPITHVTADAPATFLVHGANDRLVWPANSERLAARLAEVDVPCELVLLPATDHLFEYVPGAWSTQIARAELLRFVDAHLIR